jgi:hypothetical protein
MSLLERRLLELHDALQSARISHAFGGAIALAYCTEDPRGTHDLDVNVFVTPSRVGEVFAALPDSVATHPADSEAAEREGQVRVWWEDTPIDLFFDVHSFHREVARGVRWVQFAGRTIPVLGCTSLAVFKALLDRTKDWADIEAMVERGTIDMEGAVASLEGMAAPEHPAFRRLTSLAS